LIYQRSFNTFSNNILSAKSFTIYNGLQQGTINSPILFNIYTCDILKLFGPNNTNCSLIAYADDLIIYNANINPAHAQKMIQDAINKIFGYYHSWKLKVNVEKFESILFRPSIRTATHYVTKHYKKFQLKGSAFSNEIIPHKKIVKYLGVFLDERLLFGQHIETQLCKARKTFISYGKLFYSKILNNKVKLICYQLLIRPIITYGCEIWYNISASMMEQIRVFERRCLRACTNTYRSEELNFQKYVNNRILYDRANISRIDIFILNLIREYFLRSSQILNNSLIYPLLYIWMIISHRTRSIFKTG